MKAFEIFKKGTAATLNVGTGKGYSVREFADACGAVTAHNISIVEGPGREGDAAEVYANCDKARQVLGWTPQYVELKEALKAGWDWALKESGTAGS